MPNLLKRLELNGFKSFAQKTVFDFSGGITAIVGPNGSGKSNVIDAIRWLLGERDAKNLRGGKGEDLIFAGTAKRPRLGQAHAMLHFTNENKFFPIEFAEIAVAREVSRDGTNRYFLNKSEVRLKDVVDFFAKSRLGARGLVVVSQGKSDMFIESAPAERREMIEEMLGLREFQLKRQEAERRLKNTQVNLDKGRALLEEILPHLRSLKRQTGRWEKRAELAEELKNLEDGFFGMEYEELSQTLAAAETELQKRKAGLAALREEKKAAEDYLKKVEAGEPRERRELAEVRKETQALLEKKSELLRELGRVEAREEMEVPVVSSSSHSSETLLALVTKIKNKLTEMVDIDYEDLQHAVQEILEDIDAILGEGETRGAARLAKNSSLEGELARVRDGVAEVEQALESLREKEQGLQKNQERFYKTFKEAVAKVEAAKDKIERWESEGQAKLLEKERLAMRREEWERQVRAAGRDPREFFEGKREESFAVGDRALAERRMFKLRGELAAIGEVDESLVREARETGARYEFLGRECEDLGKAQTDLKRIIAELQFKVKTEFERALGHINGEFHKFFTIMFGGGQAKLKLASAKKVREADAEAEDKKEEETAGEGIDVDLKLPRKRATSIEMLSGGERSLVGIAALFALISVSPPPFLVLDEVDAALDERNARRFSEMLKEFSKRTQFVLVTHNRATMEVADVLYGITMNDDATSKVVSLRLEA